MRCPKIAQYFLDNLRRVFAATELVTIIESLPVCRDPDDDKFLALGVNDSVEAVVSGDDYPFALDIFWGTRIISAAAFGRALILW